MEDDSASVTVRVQSIHTMTHLCQVLNFSDYASRMIHSLTRLLESVTQSGLGLDVGMDKKSNSSNVEKDNFFPNNSKKSRSIAVRALIKPTMDALCALARQLGDGFEIFAPTVSRLLSRM